MIAPPFASSDLQLYRSIQARQGAEPHIGNNWREIGISQVSLPKGEGKAHACEDLLSLVIFVIFLSLRFTCAGANLHVPVLRIKSSVCRRLQPPVPWAP